MPRSTKTGPDEELVAQCLAKAREACADFDDENADAAYEEALIALGSHGKRDPRYLEILDEMARMLRLDDAGETEAILLRRLALQRETWGARSEQEAGELWYLASYYAAENRYVDAIDTYRQALRLYAGLEPPQSETVASLRLAIARLLSTKAPGEEAEEAWALAKEAAIDAFGADSPRIAPVAFGVAQLRLSQLRLDEAETLARGVIAALPQSDDESGQLKHPALCLLAEILKAQGRRDEEAKVLRQALDALEAEIEVNPLALPALLERLARSVAALGDLDEAASYYDLSVKAWNAVAWPIGARPELLDEYAGILRRIGRTEAADVLAKQAEYDRSMQHRDFDCSNGDELIDWLQRHSNGPDSTQSA